MAPRARRQTQTATATPLAPTEPVASVPLPTAATASAGAHESRMERIAKRAYAIYERRGGQGGRDLEDWLQAEREIDSEA